MGKQYNNSAKSKMIRVAADEKDKKGASKEGKKRLDRDIKVMIDAPTKMYGGPKMGAKKGDQSKTRLDYESPNKMYNGPKMETNAQEKKNLMMDDPIDTRASVGGPKMKAGSWMSKHINRM